jgi:hypothetical protein
MGPALKVSLKQETKNSEKIEETECAPKSAGPVAYAASAIIIIII